MQQRSRSATVGSAPMTEEPLRPADGAATFCATLVDEWARAGVTHACIAPGSRSTPIALALAAEERIAVSVHHDERSAAFAALGLGLVLGRPAVVVTTSGTAAVELHPAIVEAHQSRVPLIAVTADRPPELHGVGAAQTVDQEHLFGGACRHNVAPGVADWAVRHTWRSLADRCVREAIGVGADGAPGPVHANLAFREPLLGEVLAVPTGRRRGAPWHGPLPAPAQVGAAAAPLRGSRPGDESVRLARSARGVVVAGRGAAAHRLELGRLGWPVLADPRSGLAAGAGGRGLPLIAHADPVLRVEAFAAQHRPEVILRLGEPPASRVVNEWLAASGAPEVVVAPGWNDPGRAAARFAAGFTVAPGRPPTGWAESWRSADNEAANALVAELRRIGGFSEPAVARAVIESAAPGSTLVVSSSMPIRDVEWYTRRRDDIAVLANRGANGIDGVVSTAVGVALSGRRTIALVGDLAFLHDSTALLALARRDVDLVVVVIDNDGGGIFSFLGQAEALGPDRFEQLFGTPHGADPAAVAAAFGLAVSEAANVTELRRALGASGPRVSVVRSERGANVEVHRRLNQAVAKALTPAAD